MQLVNWLNPLVEWLWNNKDYILQQDYNNIERPGDRFGFNIFYPEYADIPDEICKYLSNEHTNILNRYTVQYLLNYPDKQQFCQKICDVLSNSTIIFEDTCKFIKK